MLNRWLFYLLLAALCARALSSEAFDRAELPFLDPNEAAAGPSPATAAAMDGLLLLASVVALVRTNGIRGTTRGSAAWAGLATLLLAAGVAISAAFAGDKRAALNAGTNLVIAVLAGVALVRLMTQPWALRLVIAALVATGATMAVKCVLQHTTELPEMYEAWQQRKQILLERGYPPDDPLIVNYDRRARSAEAFGYHYHPNITASMLMMTLLVSGGVMAAAIAALRRASPSERISPANGRTTNTHEPTAGAHSEARAATLLTVLLSLSFAVLIGGAMFLTGSLGAQVAALLGAATLLTFGALRRWIAPRPRTAFIVMIAGYALLCGAGVVYGLARDTLPGASLAFRWHYWTAAARALADAPVTGVGRQNFGDAFLRYKSPASVEEVSDPHNIWVTLLVETGPCGLLGGLLLAAVILWRGVSRLSQCEPGGKPAPLPSPRLAAAIADRAVADVQLADLWPLPLLFALVHALCFGMGLSNPGVVFIWLIEVVGAWTLGFVLLCWILQAVWRSDRTAGWITSGLLAAVLGALVHNIVDFSLVAPAGLAIFVLCAAGVACRSTELPNSASSAGRPAIQSGRAVRTIAALAAAILCLAHLRWILLPTATAAKWLQGSHTLVEASTAASLTPEMSGRFARAADADPLDPVIPRSLATLTLRQSMAPNMSDADRLVWLATAGQFARLASERNPRASMARRVIATIAIQRAGVLRRVGQRAAAEADLRAARDNMEMAVERYPTNPRLHIQAARFGAALWQEAGDVEAARLAGEHLQLALHLDRQRPAGEIQRLSEQELRATRDLADQLRPAGVP